MPKKRPKYEKQRFFTNRSKGFCKKYGTPTIEFYDTLPPCYTFSSSDPSPMINTNN